MAIRGAHGVGKDWMAARIAWWFRVAYAPANIYLTGPSETQVRDVIWQEIKKVAEKCKSRGFDFGGIWKDLYHETKDSFMRAFVAKQAENIQGRHAENQLIILDEASGIPREIYDAALSLMTGPNNWVIAISNPTFDPGGWFPELFTVHAGNWKRFHFDGYEIANHKVPGLISWEWIKEREEEWGKDSQLALAKIRGEFPTESADTLIPLAWIERAILRSKEKHEPTKNATLGCDVARRGSNETVIAIAEGNRVIRLVVRQGQDLMATCGEIIALARDYDIPAENWRIDDTGLGGGLTDRLKELKHYIMPINFGSKPREEEKFLNARAEMYWQVRELCRLGLSVFPDDRFIIRDFSSVRYQFDSAGRIKMEDKDHMCARLGFSPDRADAICLALAPAEAVRLYSGKSNMGLLRFYERMVEKLNITKEPLTTKPATEIPGAAELLRN
jgi:hypothetical protein